MSPALPLLSFYNSIFIYLFSIINFSTWSIETWFWRSLSFSSCNSKSLLWTSLTVDVPFLRMFKISLRYLISFWSFLTSSASTASMEFCLTLVTICLALSANFRVLMDSSTHSLLEIRNQGQSSVKSGKKFWTVKTFIYCPFRGFWRLVNLAVSLYFMVKNWSFSYKVGASVAIKQVLVFPPRLSWSRRVSLDSL